MHAAGSLGRQQDALAELGRRVITPTELGTVLQSTVELVAETLGVEHVTVLEITPGGGEMRLRAGVGWQAGDVGHTIDAMPGGFVGFTLHSIEPVVVRDMRDESRFVPSPVLLDQGVRASVASRIPGPGGRPFGVIGAHAGAPGAFDRDEASFVAGVAGMLASAISRHRRAIEINDEILQTLVLAQYALRQGRPDAGALLDRAIRRTRGLVSTLLGESGQAASATLPGDLRRSGAADVAGD